MANLDSLSSRMNAIVAAVLPKIATTIDEKSSSGPSKIDLATAEHWLVRKELVEVFKKAFADDSDENVTASTL